MSHTVILMYSMSLYASVIFNILFLQLFMFLVQVKLAWSTLFSSLQRYLVLVRLFISQVNGLHPSCPDIKSKGMRHSFTFARKCTDVRCEMFISIYIKTSAYESIVLERH